jgi:glutamate synthase domain-containing protein 1/glutamate synthase domain-containing protein 3
MESVIASRQGLRSSVIPRQKHEAEGGCGVIGIASDVMIPGRHLLQSLLQMRNRGNGKGGGIAIAGLESNALGVTPDLLAQDTMLTLAYLDQGARGEVEQTFIESAFELDHVHEIQKTNVLRLEPEPPEVVIYFVRPRQDAIQKFADEKGLSGIPAQALHDEFVYQNSFNLNSRFYASLGDQSAFVLSHARDLMVLKLVGYGDDVIHTYQLQDLNAHVWIGHHRYPTKGKVWHPGGAHPFVGLNEALVHNGDFANYASVCSYLAQFNIHPLFLTDTEVSALVFDLLHRTFEYPLEYVIEAMAPTTERDFAMLPQHKQEIYRMLQEVHIHGSPDGPWFFLIAQSERNDEGACDVSLLGITDTSMLRPQVFALQQGEPGQPSIGFAASELQAIHAAMHSLAAEDERFWSHPDLVWNARGGSHTDGGAFVFRVHRDETGSAQLVCRDKFGSQIKIEENTIPHRVAGEIETVELTGQTTEALYEEIVEQLPRASYAWMRGALHHLLSAAKQDEKGMRIVLDALTMLKDRRYSTGALRRSSILSLTDEALGDWLALLHDQSFPTLALHRSGEQHSDRSRSLVIQAGGYASEGEGSLALEIARLVRDGTRELIIVGCGGQRFIGNSLGSNTEEVTIHIYGSSGDYLASGIDGARIVVHGSGQDQLAQIMKEGELVVHGDVGQTFMYGAKGGQAFVLGNAAGRPLINAVGSPKVIINGTCLDYLAESFMAGDPFNGGGFVIVNGVTFDGAGKLTAMDTPYPGGNLFSLASGGAIFIRDPERKLGVEQLNGGEFVPFENRHWELIRPLLEKNEAIFGIKLEDLLSTGSARLPPTQVYRAIMPSGHKALQAEEAWVAQANSDQSLHS